MEIDVKVHFEQSGDVGRIVLDDGPLNLLGPELVADLTEAVTAAEKAVSADTPMRALLVSSIGEHFSAGADVRIFQGLSAEQAQAAILENLPVFTRLERLPVPTLAMVNGLCLAGGMELALSCDMTWASEGAQFGLIEATIGGFPFAGGAQRLAARAGVARAREAVYGGTVYPASRMYAWGVVNRVLPPEDLEGKAVRYVQRLAAGPTRALAVAKQLIGLTADSGVGTADTAMPALAGEIVASQDLQEGAASLLNHGPGHATFTGR
ncbi:MULTISPECIES: enoyl-CoA hydratase/isomerase family protein [unclassified Streptomyces]|uniref:enoyl-CoA hydratase/isomerase family protein n=1 Tax=unclassified Streptomyces TaxID=2593676 RepID=UPI000F45BD0F|nr:enoyl-CoA hydratase/isomerase family protein [Streptomyces sp. I6]RNL73910.1 enoyl-CoA hydratase/isomerase family protein [Streptomyces sp. I6]